MRRIYLASSWRNDLQPRFVTILRAWGHAVYDFRNPPHGQGGFSWSMVDKKWESWTPSEYKYYLENSAITAQGYLIDLRAMEWADTFVLLMPCGRSAHLELGWGCGRGKRTIIFLRTGEPELMALMADHLVTTEPQLQEVLL